MSIRSIRKQASEQGMSTSEYAVGTVGACGIGGLLYTLAGQGWFQDMLKGVFERVTDILPF